MEEEIEKIRSNRNLIMGIIITIGILICIFLIVMNSNFFSPRKKCSENPFTIMSQEQKDLYNEKIEKHIGNINGSEVKLLIEEIISNNNQYVGDSGKFISIYAENIKGYTDIEKLAEVNKKANIYENNNDGDNNQENINKATEEYRKIAKKISSQKDYKVEAEYKTGVIYKVKITQTDKK